MFPVGADVLRTPASGDFRVRNWHVIDQVLPVPFPLGSQDLDNANWLPLADSLSDAFNEVRRYSQFRAHHFTEPFDDSQVTTDSRLIGRSVWNREWIVIIPGGSLLADPNEGLDTFIDGQLIPDTDERDGQGVSDIRIFLQNLFLLGELVMHRNAMTLSRTLFGLAFSGTGCKQCPSNHFRTGSSSLWPGQLVWRSGHRR